LNDEDVCLDAVGILDDEEDTGTFDDEGLNEDDPTEAVGAPFTPEADAEAGGEVDTLSVADDVDEIVGLDTGVGIGIGIIFVLEIGPGSIVLLLCLTPGFTTSPLLRLLALVGEARIPCLALTPETEEDVGEGSIVLLLCLGPGPGPSTPKPIALVRVVVVRSVGDPVFVRTGREVTLNDGVGARCLIGIGAILSSSLSSSVSFSFSFPSISRSDTGECG
jgi:hypothetical protein